MANLLKEQKVDMNELSVRKYLIKNYAHLNTSFMGENSENETVILSISENGIILNTYQKNGFVRINYFDSDGFPEGETFNGRWKNIPNLIRK